MRSSTCDAIHPAYKAQCLRPMGHMSSHIASVKAGMGIIQWEGHGGGNFSAFWRHPEGSHRDHMMPSVLAGQQRLLNAVAEGKTGVVVCRNEEAMNFHLEEFAFLAQEELTEENLPLTCDLGQVRFNNGAMVYFTTLGGFRDIFHALTEAAPVGGPIEVLFALPWDFLYLLHALDRLPAQSEWYVSETQA